MIPESCTLIGVVDETGLLEENEVFIQIRRDNFSSRENPDSDFFANDDRS